VKRGYLRCPTFHHCVQECLECIVGQAQARGAIKSNDMHHLVIGEHPLVSLWPCPHRSCSEWEILWVVVHLIATPSILFALVKIPLFSNLFLFSLVSARAGTPMAHLKAHQKYQGQPYSARLTGRHHHLPQWQTVCLDLPTPIRNPAHD
jgi:hypothetical protein